MSKNKQENDMICTGAMPPQVIAGMELYQAWMQTMMFWCQSYMSIMQAPYWTQPPQDKSEE